MEHGAWQQLLAFLAGDRSAGGGAAYERARQRLHALFTWRGATDPAALTDATLDRVARKLAEGEPIQTSAPIAFVLGVARYVLLEAHKAEARARDGLERAALEPAGPTLAERGREEARVAALEACLHQLPERERALVLRYYRGRGQARIEARAAAAEALEITPRALRLRMYRLRSRLAECVERNVSEVEATQGDTYGSEPEAQS